MQKKIDLKTITRTGKRRFPLSLLNKNQFVHWRQLRKNARLQRDAKNKLFIYQGKAVFSLGSEVFQFRRWAAARAKELIVD